METQAPDILLNDEAVKVKTDEFDMVIKCEEGKGVMVTDADAEPDSDLPDTLKLMKIKSVMCVPLISRSQVRGVIYVDSITKPYGFRREDFALFEALSVPATNAVENAVLYAKRRRGGGA